MKNLLASFSTSIVRAFKLKFNTAQSYGILPGNRSPIVNFGRWDTRRASREGYASNTYVYACITKWMRSIQVVPLKVYLKQGDEWVEAPASHPLQKLLNKPNPFIELPRMMRIMTAHLQLAGNGLWSKIRDSKGNVIELWPINPDSIAPVPSENDYISHYVPLTRTTPKRIEPEDIIHVQLDNPACPYWGIGPLQAAARALESDNAATKWNFNAMENRAVPDGILSFKGPIAPDQYEKARERMRERQGSKNAREFMIMNQEVSWQTLGLTPVEMDFLQSRKFTREEMASVFSVPPILLGISENSPLSNENVKAASRMFWTDYVLPFLDIIRETLNLSLTTEFGTLDQINIDYDITGIEALQADMQAKATTAKVLWDMGVPFNEINQRLELGFESIEGGDTGYLSPNLYPVNLANQIVQRIIDEPAAPAAPAQPDPANPSPEADPEEGEKAKYTKAAIKGIEDFGRAMRVENWKVLERQREPFDVEGARKFAATLTNEGNDAAAAFMRAQDGATMEQREKQALDAITGKPWEKELGGFYKEVIEDFGNRTNERFSKQLQGARRNKGFEIKAFDLTTAAIVAWIDATAAKRATLIAEASQTEVARVIKQGVLAGLAVDQIAKAIRIFYAERKAFRAMTIARTEVVAASNYGSWQGAKQTSVPMIRTWLATSDDRTREDHEQADGDTASMDGSFSVGGENLMYPGDPSGSAANVINCRCGVQYNVDPSFLNAE